jgi:TIR domain
MASHIERRKFLAALRRRGGLATRGKRAAVRGDNARRIRDEVSDIFLSYARADDEEFVRRLYGALTADGFTVWFDRESMPSRSLTFLHEIRAAIDGVDRVLVVVGPVALKSDYVRAEWQHAQAAEKVVVPILREGNYTDLPAEFRNLHAIDFRPARDMDEACAELHRVLSDPIPPLGALHGELPGLPPHFQPRPDDLAKLADIVLVDLTSPVSVTGPAALTVIHGMAGVGKSVITESPRKVPPAFSCGVAPTQHQRPFLMGCA